MPHSRRGDRRRNRDGLRVREGRYVVIDPDEIEKLRTEGDKAISVNAFVPSDAIDPIYHSGKSYYVVPDSPVGQKPFGLLRQCMAEKNLCGVGQAVISNREQVVMLRPVENLLAMTVLEYDARVKKPSAFADEIADSETSGEEFKLTNMLVQALTKNAIDMSQFRDLYTEKLSQVIEAKVEGKKLVTPPPVEHPQIVNLMDALRASMHEVGVPSEVAAAKKKPARKMAASRKARPAAETSTAAPKRQRKSG